MSSNVTSEPKETLEELLFGLAVQKPTALERAAFLDGVCRDNAALRATLDRLLSAHFHEAGFLPMHRTEPLPSRLGASAVESPMIGRYKLLEKIGEGGFGEVWMADQREPVKRRVALKIIKLGMDTRQIVARFEAERQALALMDHPNIARVLDGGATETGRPYFVMELVRGEKITEFCDKNSLSAEQRMKLFILVCQAIQHAHQKGIIHRDIKPSNILVTLHDGVPVPKVIDFGIAKATQFELTDKTVFTQFQQFIGTPAYISPEQAEMSGLDIDTRADIYSLGVLLYELLAGQTPFDAAEMIKDGLDALRQIIREREPVRPSTKLTQQLAAVDKNRRKATQELALPTQDEINAESRQRLRLKEQIALLRGDLDWIVMKCLEKDRNRRYQTANGLAMDIQRYLANEPVVARPPSTAYKIQKAWQRNRLAFSAGVAVALVFLAAISVVIFVQHRANTDYRRRLYVSEVNRAGLAWAAGQSEEMRVLLERCPPALRNWEWNFLDQQAGRWQGTTVPGIITTGAAELSADGNLLVAEASNALQVREFPNGRWVSDIPFAAAWNSPFVLSPAGEWVATLDHGPGNLTVWNLRTGQPVAAMHHGASATALDWSADGDLVASGGDQGIRVWEALSGREVRTLPVAATVRVLAFAPDGQTIAVGTTAKDALLLDAVTGSVKRRFQTRAGPIAKLKFSPDGRKIVIANNTFGGFQRDHRVWSVETEEGSLDLNVGTESIGFGFSPESRRLAIADASGAIRLWDLDRRAEVERISAHAGFATSVRWLPDDRLLSAGSDQAVRIWQARSPGVVQLKGYPSSLRTLAFSPDSRRLALAGLDRRVDLWNPNGAQRAGTYTNHVGSAFAVAFGPDGRVASADGHQLQVWNPATLETSWSTVLEPLGSPWWVHWSQDGRRLYASSPNNVWALDAATGKQLKAIAFPEGKVSTDGLAVSPDSRLIVLGQKARILVLRANTLEELWQAPAHPDRSVAFSPDGKWIASGDLDGGISLWEVASEGKVHRTLRGHAAPVSGVSFHPNGTRLVSSGKEGLVKVWDWRAGVELLTLPVPGGGLLWHTVVSPDGKIIAAAGGDGVVSLWRVD